MGYSIRFSFVFRCRICDILYATSTGDDLSWIRSWITKLLQRHADYKAWINMVSTSWPGTTAREPYVSVLPIYNHISHTWSAYGFNPAVHTFRLLRRDGILSQDFLLSGFWTRSSRRYSRTNEFAGKSADDFTKWVSHADKLYLARLIMGFIFAYLISVWVIFCSSSILFALIFGKLSLVILLSLSLSLSLAAYFSHVIL